MAIYYEEFDTTVSGLVAALQSKIAAHAAWDAFVPTPVTFTNTAAFTSVNLNASSVAGLFIGQRLKWTVSSVVYARVIVNIVGTTVTIDATIPVSTPSGTTFSTDTNIVKATTTRGAEMILDLQAGTETSETYRMNLRFWRTMPAAYSAVSQIESADRFIYWKTSGGSSTNPLHVTLSVGKEHLFIAVEGPRWNEAGASSASYGSLKNYAFISDVVPYHAADTTPFVAAGAHGGSGSAPATVGLNDHEIDISRNYANTASWSSGRMGTIWFPSVQSDAAVTLQRDCIIDNKTYLFPYVVVSNTEGVRGRLARFFNAGMTHPTPNTDIGDPVGSKVTFDGVTYKLCSINKSEASQAYWGPFGAVKNDGASATYRSVVVAVPFSE